MVLQVLSFSLFLSVAFTPYSLAEVAFGTSDRWDRAYLNFESDNAQIGFEAAITELAEALGAEGEASQKAQIYKAFVLASLGDEWLTIVEQGKDAADTFNGQTLLERLVTLANGLPEEEQAQLSLFLKSEILTLLQAGPRTGDDGGGWAGVFDDEEEKDDGDEQQQQTLRQRATEILEQL